MTRTQDLQSQRNSISKEIGKIMKQGGDPAPIKAQVAQISEELAQVKQRQDQVLEEIKQYYLTIPNLPDASLPSR